MKKEDVEIIRKIVEDSIEPAVKKAVNGKVDALRRKVEEHLEEMKPFMQGWRGAKVLGNLIKWAAGVIIAILALAAAVMNLK